MMKTPVLLLIFNRPDLTQQVFNRIRETRPKHLYIAADGPRRSREGEADLCRETRRMVATVDWDCEVHHLFREENLGCKLAVSQAINWFFEHVESGIILEDDCLPDLSFFPFCHEMLNRYRDDPRIGIVSGNNFQPEAQRHQADHSYYFSNYSHIWGWASWRRVWTEYDVELSHWSGNLEAYADHIPNRYARATFSSWMQKIRTGSVDTWDYQLLYLMISGRRFVITPWKNLVANIGFDERATHTSELNPNLPAAVAMPFPLTHPLEIVANGLADRYTETRIFGIPQNLPTYLCQSVRAALKQILSPASKM